MRIRKRWPPPPLPPSPPDLQSSTLLPPPSPESQPLHHRNDLSVDDNTNLTPPCDSPKEDEDRRRPDLHLVPVSRTNADVADEKKKTQCIRRSSNQDPPIGVGDDHEEAAADEKRMDAINRRIVYNSSIETSAGSSISSSLSHQEHWCEEDKVFPLKKRRASFKNKVSEKKKWFDDNNDDDENVVEKDMAKKRGSAGGKLMEGSRCSRMNGRGWRCSQPTLVGYSLCEHHLGKGRLRSMNNVRRKTVPKTKRKKVDTSLYLKYDNEDDDDDDNDDDDDEKGLMVAKKRKRMGIVKARSMSSLLGQTAPLPPPVTL